jgi:adenosine 3'-phospho 5'-phosphosulfate transporter B2
MSPIEGEEPEKEPEVERSAPPAKNEHSDAPEPVLTSACWCACLASGVILSLLGHGVLQERIMAMPFDGENFQSSTFVVFSNRVVAAAFSFVMVLLRKEQLSHSAPLRKYCLVSFANFAAAVCQYEALKWVAFSVQLLGKSFKMIPVMFWAIAMSGKRYPASQWCISLMVTAGVVAFMAGGNISSPRVEAQHHWQSMYGIFLLGMFLLADSFASTFQEKLFADHKTTKYNQMLYVNLCSSTISLLALVSSGELIPSLAFCAEHPRFPLDALALSGASVTSQFFIVSMVKDFGALALAATMNVRQLLSILLSCWTYGHSLTIFQVLALVVVFATLLSKSIIGVCRKLRRKNTSKDRLTDEEEEGDESPVPGDDENIDKVRDSRRPVAAILGKKTGAASAQKHKRLFLCVEEGQQVKDEEEHIVPPAAKDRSRKEVELEDLP